MRDQVVKAQGEEEICRGDETARQLGQVWWALRATAGKGFILSELGAAKPLNFGLVGMRAACPSTNLVNITNCLVASFSRPLSGCTVRNLPVYPDPSFPAASCYQGGSPPGTPGRDERSHKQGERHSWPTAASLPSVWASGSSPPCWPDASHSGAVASYCLWGRSWLPHVKTSWELQGKSLI